MKKIGILIMALAIGVVATSCGLGTSKTTSTAVDSTVVATTECDTTKTIAVEVVVDSVVVK